MNRRVFVQVADQLAAAVGDEEHALPVSGVKLFFNQGEQGRNSVALFCGQVDPVSVNLRKFPGVHEFVRLIHHMDAGNFLRSQLPQGFLGHAHLLPEAFVGSVHHV